MSLTLNQTYLYHLFMVYYLWLLLLFYLYHLSIPPIYTTYRYRLFYYTILISRQPWELHHIDIDYCTITTDGIYITYLYHLFCTVIGARFGTARPQATDHMACKNGGKSSIDGQERYSEMAMVISYNWIYMGLYIFDMGWLSTYNIL
jgi:hypothetical protein